MSDENPANACPGCRGHVVVVKGKVICAVCGKLVAIQEENR